MRYLIYFKKVEAVKEKEERKKQLEEMQRQKEAVAIATAQNRILHQQCRGLKILDVFIFSKKKQSWNLFFVDFGQHSIGHEGIHIDSLKTEPAIDQDSSYPSSITKLVHLYFD